MLQGFRQLAVITLTVFALSACSSLNQTAAQAEFYAVKGYGGDAKTDAQLMHVIGNGYQIFLCGFDGNHGNFSPFLKGPLYYKGFDVALAPGTHKLCITYGFTNTYHTDPIQLPISGDAGDRFIVNYAVDSSQSFSVGLLKKNQFVKFSVLKNGVEQNSVVVPMSSNFY